MGNSDFLFAKPSFWGGMSRLFDFGGTLNSYNISPTGEIADARAFYEDWKAIGDDMRSTLQLYKKNQKNKINAQEQKKS